MRKIIERECGHRDLVFTDSPKSVAHKICFDCYKKREEKEIEFYEYAVKLPTINAVSKAQLIFARAMRYKILSTNQFNFTILETNAGWWISQAYKCGVIKRKTR